ncbi:MAG: SRPBCC family protein [Gordonia sp.]|uniref:SRPBCC family protein n=1 Tax=Gordonia rubripertincta TaxID=36822 RepID=A0ABT4N3L8_GORRU|nr:SRPBCC family protein [Gordonia rubripertincta]MBA4023370.1 SRPBCC family protein [Gordonia sp. (in: high G+C Gram-positive bacteria)]MCZ4553874.1 SRPBCC family protein [Gordonia rubripertincta]
MAAPLLEASTEIKASPEKVWELVSDLKRMGEWSPQCRKVVVRGGGPVTLGTKTVNVNKRGLLVWPTTAKVVRFEPNKEIAYRITENGSIWSFTITPTDAGVKLTERREAPNNTKKVSQVLINVAMGGEKPFDAELVDGMNQTLSKIKAELH